MKTIVIYGTRYGNTHEVARTIAKSLGEWGSVNVLPVESAPPLPDADLVIVGGPTEGHGMSDPLRRFFSRLESGVMRGRLAAAFDTRLTWPRVLSGSAAAGIAERLRDMGADVIGPAGSFLVKGKMPALEPGELERASAWADYVGRKASAHVRVMAAKS